MENVIENDKNEIERINKVIEWFLLDNEDLDIRYETENLIIDYGIRKEKEAGKNKDF